MITRSIVPSIVRRERSFFECYSFEINLIFVQKCKLIFYIQFLEDYLNLDWVRLIIKSSKIAPCTQKLGLFKHPKITTHFALFDKTKFERKCHNFERTVFARTNLSRVWFE